MIGKIKYKILILKFVDNTERKEDGPYFFIIDFSVVNMMNIEVVIENINNMNTLLLKVGFD
jgi:hypothetical protein